MNPDGSRVLESELPPTSGSPLSLRDVTFGLVLLNLLVAVSCGIFARWEFVSSVQSATVASTNLARLIERSTAVVLDKSGVLLIAVAARVERNLQDARITPASVEVDRAAIAQVPEVQRIGVFDDLGRQVCHAATPQCQGLDVSDREYFRAYRDMPSAPPRLFGPYTSKVDNALAFAFVKPVRRKNGEFAGLVLAVLPVRALARSLQVPNLGELGAAALRSETLSLIARHPLLPAQPVEAPRTEIAQGFIGAVADNPDEGVRRSFAVTDGIERVTAYKKVAGYPLYVFVGLGLADYLDGWRAQIMAMSAVAVLFMLVSVAIFHLARQGNKRHLLAQSLYDSAPCGYHVVDSNGYYVNVNRTELEWLGCSREEVIGKKRPSDFFTPASQEIFRLSFARLPKDGAIQGLEVELCGRDGAVRNLLVNAQAVTKPDGTFIHGNTVLYDVTEQTRARAQLRVLLHEQAVMLDTELIGIAKVWNGCFVWSNQGMGRIFGYPSDRWMGMPSRQLYASDAAYAAAALNFQRQLEDAGHYRAQLDLVRMDGTRVWTDISGVKLPGDPGEVLMLISDITAVREAAEDRLTSIAVRAENAHLLEADRAKDKFLSNMTHELRTPLNAVLGFAGLLQSQAKRQELPKVLDYARKIDESGKHLLLMIDSMLDFVSQKSGALVFTPENTSIPQEVSNVVAMLRHRADARQVVVSVHVDPDLEQVFLDPFRLRQALLNYLSNAIKFSHEGGAVHVRVLPRGEDKFVVEVEDAGIGISGDDEDRLFTEFTQLSEGRTKQYAGAGVGLALVKAIVEAQGGTVGFSSTLGEGSTFWFVLPRRHAEPAARA